MSGEQMREWKPFTSLEGMVRLILLVDWDPIGIFGHAGAMTEYDSYTPDVCDLLMAGASREQLAIHLEQIETVQMGMRGDAVTRKIVAEKLLRILETRYSVLMHTSDDSECGEMPPGWDGIAARKKFSRLVSALEQRLNCRLEQDKQIEDAGHHGAAFLPPQLLAEDYTTSIRASNFGNLATIWDEGTVVQMPYLKIIWQALEEFGYVYVPSNVLHRPYDGRNPYIRSGSLWGDRFFDYL